jgi:hypothetical protein
MSQAASLRDRSGDRMFSGRFKTDWNIHPVLLLLLATILLPAVLFFPTRSSAADLIVVGINLNLETKGNFFVLPADEGDFFIRTEDLKAMGFRNPAGRQKEIAGEYYISVRSMTCTATRQRRRYSGTVQAGP